MWIRSLALWSLNLHIIYKLSDSAGDAFESTRTVINLGPKDKGQGQGQQKHEKQIIGHNFWTDHH
jgi:hypothetical protein